MTKDEFRAAVAIAQGNKNLDKVDDSHLFGFGLRDFKPTATTLDAVAKTIRWQAATFNGGWDMEALNEILTCGRKKFMIIA